MPHSMKNKKVIYDSNSIIKNYLRIFKQLPNVIETHQLIKVHILSSIKLKVLKIKQEVFKMHI